MFIFSKIDILKVEIVPSKLHYKDIGNGYFIWITKYTNVLSQKKWIVFEYEGRIIDFLKPFASFLHK